MSRKGSSKNTNFKYYIILNIAEILAVTSLLGTIALYFFGGPQIPMKIKIITSLAFIFFLSFAYLCTRIERRRDILTGVGTVEYMRIFAEKLCAFRKIQYYTSIFLNIKNLRYINRMVGNDLGDLILKDYARILKKFINRGEAVCHMGGDNFLVLIYKHRVQDFIALLNSINIQVNVKGTVKEIPVRAHGGINAMSAEDNVNDVFEKANIALKFQSQDRVQDFVWFQQDMAELLSKEKYFTFNLEQAKNDGSLMVYYQPIIDIHTSRVVSAEALVRWNKNGEILLPEEFIPLMERIGAVSEIDFWVLERVCQDIHHWIEMGNLPVRVSVNFSKVNLSTDNFTNRVLEIVNRYKIDKSLIAVELTDTKTVQDNDQLTNFITQMSQARIVTVLNDFGICFSKPELLKERRVNFIKLAKPFIDGIELENGQNPNQALVKNIVNICHDLKVNIICVGVENQNQKDILTNMRCNLLQGFFYDHPLNQEDFERRLKNPIYTN